MSDERYVFDTNTLVSARLVEDTDDAVLGVPAQPPAHCRRHQQSRRAPDPPVSHVAAAFPVQNEKPPVVRMLDRWPGDWQEHRPSASNCNPSHGCDEGSEKHRLPLIPPLGNWRCAPDYPPAGFLQYFQ
jgi:hypothetical protein